MRTTLSQAPFDSAGGGARPEARARLASFGLVVLLVTAACPRGETDPAAASAGASTDAAAFEWPADPTHPRLRIDVAGASVEGAVVIELMPELAPFSVVQIVDLAKNGYFDGTTFHRVIPGFMIQGGDPNSRDRDPTNDGYGDFEIRFEDEFGDAPFVRGVVALANAGRPNTSGGQFFILLDDQRHLDGRHTVIGRVVSGMDVVDAIASVETDRHGRWGPKDRPIENVSLARVALESEPAMAAAIPQGMDDGDATDR